MALTPQRKQQLFEKVRTDTVEGIKRDHKDFSYRVKGWCKNKYRSVLGLSNDSTVILAGKVVAKLALLPLQIPLLKSGLDAAITAGLNAAQGMALEWDMDHSGDRDEKILVTGEWAVLKGAEAFKDAVRKIDDAAAAFNGKSDPKNCDEFLAKLKSFYYWRYRLDRLRYYHKILQGYLTSVDAKLADAQRTWDQLEAKVKEGGPKVFDDWTWHHSNCRDTETCVFPWDQKDALDISAPKLVSTTADLAAMKLRPIQAGKPPIPPKPQFPMSAFPPKPPTAKPVLPPRPLFPPKKP